MRFDNCRDCGKYKYLKKNGLCPTCSEQSEVRVKLDIIDETLRKPEQLTVIAKTMESVSSVECDGASDFSGKKHDDLDLKENYCRLFEAEKEYRYEDYTGDKSERVRNAMRDALQDAKSIYTD